MPEGPEVRLAADRVAAALRGRAIEEAWFAPHELRARGETLVGAIVTAVETRGKAMLTRFDNGLTLYSHNQLYGRWYTTRRGRRPDTTRDLRVALHNGRHSAWLYSASDVELLDEAGLAAHPFLAKLGPDVLDDSLEAGMLASRLAENRFHRRSLGSLYLDQRFLAGIGNYLRSEILFASRLHPALAPRELAGAERKRLARESLKLARRSYATRGVTLPASRARGGDRFWVFGRDDLPCRRCGAVILRMDVGSRRLYLCPGCQSRDR